MTYIAWHIGAAANAARLNRRLAWRIIVMEFIKKNTWIVLVVGFGLLIAVGIGLS